MPWVQLLPFFSGDCLFCWEMILILPMSFFPLELRVPARSRKRRPESETALVSASVCEDPDAYSEHCVSVSWRNFSAGLSVSAPAAWIGLRQTSHPPARRPEFCDPTTLPGIRGGKRSVRRPAKVPVRFFPPGRFARSDGYSFPNPGANHS